MAGAGRARQRMSKPRTIVPKPIRDELEATGLPWAAEMGKKHVKVRLNGRIVLVTSKSGATSPRDIQNGIATIRRAARECMK